jgi:hypothetical protein
MTKRQTLKKRAIPSWEGRGVGQIDRKENNYYVADK